MAFLAATEQDVLLRKLKRHCRKTSDSPNTLRQRAGFTCSSFYRAWGGVSRLRESTAKRLCEAAGWRYSLNPPLGRPRHFESVIDAATECYTRLLRNGLHVSLASGGEFPDTAVLLIEHPSKHLRIVLSRRGDGTIRVEVSQSVTGESWREEYTGPYSHSLAGRVGDWLEGVSATRTLRRDSKFHTNLQRTYNRIIP